MTTTHEPAPSLGEDQAREIINRWSAGGFFRLRNMGEKIFIDRITPGAAYTVRLQTHYEQRSVKHTQEAFTGGPVDDRGRPPDPWEVPVHRPAPFQDRTEKVPIPHTERVQMCSRCAGEGRVNCAACNGRGERPCPFCGGAGFLEHQVLATAPDAQGTSVPVPRTERRPCSCGGGLVRCSQCSGRGIVTCADCAGSGKVKTFDQVIVRFQAATQGEVLDVTPVPDPWLGKLSGQVLVEQQAPRIEQFDPVTPEVDQKARDLLSKSQAVDEDRVRILLQALRIQRIALHEVTYKYAGVERRLWICGDEQALYAPKAPWNRSRLLLLVTGLVVGVAALVGLVAFIFMRH
jgi:hypothetical protein